MESNKRRFTLLFWLVAAAGLIVLHQVTSALTAPETIPYNEFLVHLEEGQVERVHLEETTIVAEIAREGSEEETVHVNRLPNIDETRLLERLEEKNIEFTGKIEQTSWWQTLLVSLVLPLGILAALYFWAMNRLGQQGGAGPLSFGKSRSKIYDQNQADAVTFGDVAGVEEARSELREVVSFLRNPKKYAEIGAQIPKGVLLVGSPGTGKTLLARAVAGEAGVPFFTLSGSEFVEMFVGVGASRMRDLFEQAKERAPCIIFIDELDAIGKSRGGVGAMATHDEREQTLNQLLAEMDGFDPSKGVVIMSATNRPEVLDPALLRAGRFDRRVLVDRPDVRGRKAILEVHARKVRLGDDVDLDVIARRTPGMVGADLANVVNEAALAAARRDSKVVRNEHFEEAIDRLQLGLERRSHVLGQEEKRRIAYHETGHALVALSVDHADPVHRVTIIPRSIGALGATLQLPTEDRNLVTRPELSDRIAVMLGGRIAEELALGEVSTGAENDLERATETARQMVTRLGMSDELGPVTYGRRSDSRFLQGEMPAAEERNYSEETARRIDAEVRALIDREYRRAQRILSERRPALDRITARLLEEETLEREQLEAILAETPEEAPAAAS